MLIELGLNSFFFINYILKIFNSFSNSNNNNDEKTINKKINVYRYTTTTLNDFSESAMSMHEMQTQNSTGPCMWNKILF